MRLPMEKGYRDPETTQRRASTGGFRPGSIMGQDTLDHLESQLNGKSEEEKVSLVKKHFNLE